MKTLISSNEILQKYVPNTLKAVAGELSLFDKIAYHLQQSETWLTQTFTKDKGTGKDNHRRRLFASASPLPYGCRC